MQYADRLRLVVLLAEPADALEGVPDSGYTVTATFTLPVTYAVSLPRVGDRLEPRSLGERVQYYFTRSPQVIEVKHRLGNLVDTDPRAYVVVRIDDRPLTREMVADFEADGYQPRFRYTPPEDGPSGMLPLA